MAKPPSVPVQQPEERRKREDAVRSAWASVEIEGFKPSPDDQDHAARFINGEIDLTEFVRVKHVREEN